MIANRSGPSDWAIHPAPGPQETVNGMPELGGKGFILFNNWFTILKCFFSKGTQGTVMCKTE